MVFKMMGNIIKRLYKVTMIASAIMPQVINHSLIS